MSGPTPNAARRALRDTLQRAVSCVTAGVLTSEVGAVESELALVTRLTTASGGQIMLSIRHFYTLIGSTSHERRDRWQARTTAYYYTLDDADGREIVAYHWHPAGRSHVTEPHLHLGAGAGALRAELVKAHFVTGMVTPVALLRLVTEQFGVRPRRADWSAVLGRAQAALGTA